MSASDKSITITFDPPTEPDWNSYGALPTTDAALAIVKALAIVPTVNGGVQFEIHAGGVEFEVEFDADGKFGAIVFDAERVPTTGEQHHG